MRNLRVVLDGIVLLALWCAVVVTSGLIARAMVGLFCIGYGC